MRGREPLPTGAWTERIWFGTCSSQRASRSGVFYHQFTDKTELLIVLLDEALVLARASIDDAQHPADPWTPLNVAVDAYDRLLAMVDDHEDLVRIQLREASHPDPLVRKPLARIREDVDHLVVLQLSAIE